jgi:hypothetical protein
MSRLLSIVFAVLMLLSFAPASRAQSYETTPRVILGGEGGTEFGNTAIGALTSVEIPIKRFELDFSNTFDLYESHVALGKGIADQFGGRGILWVNHVGFVGGVDYSMYRVSITKSAEYAKGGIAFRSNMGGVPARVFFLYTHELNNGLFPHIAAGTETPRLQSGAVQLQARLQCNRNGNMCLRLSGSFDVGVVKNQSNPICDGSLGVTGGNGPGGSCFRTFTLSGGAEFGLSLEIRHKSHDVEEIF